MMFKHKDFVQDYKCYNPDMKKKTPELIERLRHTPLWVVIVGLALLGIGLRAITGDDSIGQLLVLIIFVLLSVKLLSFFLRITSFVAKVILVVMVLAYWLLTSAGFGR